MCREISAKPLVEQQADQFASALLMPAKLIRRATEQVIIPSGEMSVRALRATAGKVIRAGGFSNVSNKDGEPTDYTRLRARCRLPDRHRYRPHESGSGKGLFRHRRSVWKKVRQMRRLFQ